MLLSYTSLTLWIPWALCSSLDAVRLMLETQDSNLDDGDQSPAGCRYPSLHPSDVKWLDSVHSLLY